MRRTMFGMLFGVVTGLIAVMVLIDSVQATDATDEVGSFVRLAGVEVRLECVTESESEYVSMSRSYVWGTDGRVVGVPLGEGTTPDTAVNDLTAAPLSELTILGETQDAVVYGMMADSGRIRYAVEVTRFVDQWLVTGGLFCHEVDVRSGR